MLRGIVRPEDVVIIAPDWRDIGEAIVGVRGDREGCGYGKGEDEGCADEQRDTEKHHFDDGEEMEMENIFVSCEEVTPQRKNAAHLCHSTAFKIAAHTCLSRTLL